MSNCLTPVTLNRKSCVTTNFVKKTGLINRNKHSNNVVTDILGLTELLLESAVTECAKLTNKSMPTITVFARQQLLA